MIKKNGKEENRYVIVFPNCDTNIIFVCLFDGKEKVINIVLYSLFIDKVKENEREIFIRCTNPLNQRSSPRITLTYTLISFFASYSWRLV